MLDINGNKIPWPRIHFIQGMYNNFCYQKGNRMLKNKWERYTILTTQINYIAVWVCAREVDINWLISYLVEETVHKCGLINIAWLKFMPLQTQIMQYYHFPQNADTLNKLMCVNYSMQENVWTKDIPNVSWNYC